jgi:hypothetical protein
MAVVICRFCSWRHEMTEEAWTIAEATIIHDQHLRDHVEFLVNQISEQT